MDRIISDLSLETGRRRRRRRPRRRRRRRFYRCKTR